ncbi:MAG: dihydrolipoyl dehydrogenase [Kiritimatiellae bacterium]|nr:dihydrolipoyl dehydrogenase [Kiritimatiellia bacterium]
MEEFDVVVIGAGPGGYPAAIRAAQLGASVAVVEKEQLGGTCLNWGCIPTKTLIASADLYHRAVHSGELGLKIGAATADFAAMAKRKREVVTGLRGGIGQLLKSNGITVLAGQASFRGRNRLAVRGPEGDRAVQCGRTIIATGSEPAMPGFLPKHDRILDSRRFLDLTRLPGALIVLGGGVIGCEFACMAAQLGVRVTVVEMLDDILFTLDRDVRHVLRQHMESALGIDMLTGVSLADVTAGDKGVTASAGSKRIKADLLLVAVGRRPVTAGLNLEALGFSPDEKGFIPVDAGCRTPAATVYAVGDVTGVSQLAHAATSQGITASENACGQRRLRETCVPACIFTSPEIGSVGLTEQAAKAEGLPIRTGKFPFAALGRALAAGAPAGFVKWVVDAETDQLLGAHAVGAHATELIAGAALAIRAELTAEALGRTVHCHPTFAEAWMEAAHAVHGLCIHTAPKRRG